MKAISRFTYFLSGIGILSSAWLWIIAALTGFSSRSVVCFSTGGTSCLETNNPYWYASTALWLAPLIIFLILSAWFLSMVILPKAANETISAFLILILLAGVFYVAMHLAAGNGI